MHPDIIADRYADWQQVANDFIPPQPEPTQQQKVDDLNAEYQPQFFNLQAAYTAAQIRGDIAAMNEIQTDYTSMQAEYNTKMEVITNE